MAKRRAESYESDDGFVEEAPSSKKAKAASSSSRSKNAGSAVVGGGSTDEEGNKYWEIGANRRVTISNFKGKTYVNVREYYEKDGKSLPSKKGMMMNIDTYSALLEVLPHIENILSGMGIEVTRPSYDEGEENGKGNAGAEDSDEVPAKREKKRNIEATSDEDEDD